MAKSSGACSPAGSFTYLAIGSGTNPNSFASGAVTCTQSGNVVNSSTSFFTAAMVGGILKYGIGSGGAEQYITGFTSSSIITVSSSAIVSATAFTVWMVQQTSLQTPLYFTDNYRTNSGDNQTTYNTGQIIHQRTFINPAQPISYIVNELGWQIGPSGDSLNGRITLSSTDTVSPSEYYIVVMTLTLTYSPSTPTSVGNVGTGFNSSGTVMCEYFNTATVTSTGTTSVEGCMDCSTNLARGCFYGGTYNQGTSLTGITPPFSQGLNFETSGFGWAYGGSIGLSTLAVNRTITLSVSETIFGLGIAIDAMRNSASFDLKLTTTVTRAAGTYTWSQSWSCLYSRTLVN